MSDALSRMAAAAVDDIVKDLCDRRGLRQEWEGIGDEAIYAQIKKSWADIIESHVKPAGGYRLPDPIRITGSCAGCGQPIDNGKDEILTFESTTGKLWHGHCAPMDEAQPIIPPWLRELESLRQQYAIGVVQNGTSPYERMIRLTALAVLRDNVGALSMIRIPDFVAKHLCVAGSEEPSPHGVYRRSKDYPDSWKYEGVSEGWSGGVTENTARILSAIDAAGAEVCK